MLNVTFLRIVNILCIFFFNFSIKKQLFLNVLKAREYHSDIFLDCCGLVRRVMRDLENDFGFRIGPGNQGYMFDTLPRTVNRLEDVKPGDLVFISAIYYNPKSTFNKNIALLKSSLIS